MTTNQSVMFRALAAGTPAAIFVIQDDRLRYANPALEALTGYSRDELFELDLLALVHPDDRHTADRWTSWQNDSSWAGAGRHESKLLRRDGGTVWVDVTVARFEFEGRPALIGTAIDITDRKRLELRMVQGERLEAVGRLAGGVAHDFNNLLLVIAGQAERLLDGIPHGDPLRPAATAISEAAGRAAALTQQLLAFSQRQTLVSRPLDLSTVVRKMEDVLRSTVGPAIVVDLELADTLPLVRADRARVEQILLNLTLNARDAMHGTGSLLISTDTMEVGPAMVAARPWLREGRFVRLQVRDTGVGMTHEVQQHLFEPFFTTKAPGTSAGLGLATVYGIVKQSGGFVWVDSEVGQGAGVTILLPPMDAVAEHVAIESSPAAMRPVVMIVDDEEAVRELLVTMLERGGYEVRAVGSAEEALAAGGPVDMLLTDVVLPKMSGAELAREVRRRWPHTRVLFMSGYTGDAVLDDLDFAAGRSFIQKPFGSKALLDRIRALLDVKVPVHRDS